MSWTAQSISLPPWPPSARQRAGSWCYVIPELVHGNELVQSRVPCRSGTAGLPENVGGTPTAVATVTVFQMGQSTKKCCLFSESGRIKEERTPSPVLPHVVHILPVLLWFVQPIPCEGTPIKMSSVVDVRGASSLHDVDG